LSVPLLRGASWMGEGCGLRKRGGGRRGGAFCHCRDGGKGDGAGGSSDFSFGGGRGGGGFIVVTLQGGVMVAMGKKIGLKREGRDGDWVKEGGGGEKVLMATWGQRGFLVNSWGLKWKEKGGWLLSEGKREGGGGKVIGARG